MKIPPPTKIDRGIPIPKRPDEPKPRGRRGEWHKFVQLMNETDSFFIPIGEGDDVNKIRNTVMGNVRTYGDFTTRTVDGGLRFWLTRKAAKRK